MRMKHNRSARALLLVLAFSFLENAKAFQVPLSSSQSSSFLSTWSLSSPSSTCLHVLEEPPKQQKKQQKKDKGGNVRYKVKSKRNPNRELAGAESMFSTAKAMREIQFEKLTRKWKRRWRIRLLWQRRLRRKRRERDQKAKGHEDDDKFSPDRVEKMDPWGVENARENLSIEPWACADVDEERRLAAMKIILEHDLKDVAKKKVMVGKNKVNVVDAFPDVYGDFRLLRFLRKDKVQDPVLAAGRYQEFLHWRNDNNLDEIRAMVESNPFHPPPEWNVVGDHLPCEFCFDCDATSVSSASSSKAAQSLNGPATKHNDQGDGEKSTSSNLLLPILLKIGSWDTGLISQQVQSKKMSISTFLNYWAYMFESLHKQLYEASMKEHEMVFVDEICDFTSSKLRAQFTPLFVSTLLKPWIEMTQSNYPETTKRIVILNPPRLLNLIWSVLASMASPSTVAKVRLHPGFEGTSDDFVHKHHPTSCDSKKKKP